MRSLFSGVSGLRAHQTKMDVIGNNIANVNTTAYKSKSVCFADLMYQTMQGASGANKNQGGINGKQIGLGVKVSAISTSIAQQGSAQTTNNPYDLMINGDSFFVVNNGNQDYYTRDGAFYVDGSGNLVMQSNGYRVMGWKAVEDENGQMTIDTSANLTNLQIVNEENEVCQPEATTQAVISGNIDSNDTEINSNQGKSIAFEFYDNKGYLYTAKFSIKNSSDDTYTIKLDSIMDSMGNRFDDATMQNITFGDDDKTVRLNFDAVTGNIKNVDGALNCFSSLKFNNSYAGLEEFKDININFSTMTNFNTEGVSSIQALKGDMDKLNTGRSIGEMNGTSISSNGLIYITYSNGQTKLVGQIASAKFANASGLLNNGDNLYSQTLNSGDATISDISEDGGYMSSGVLEMSNVDLAKEFTDMIITQRGFQANARIITVSDTMLEEAVNLKR